MTSLAVYFAFAAALLYIFDGLYKIPAGLPDDEDQPEPAQWVVTRVNVQNRAFNTAVLPADTQALMPNRQHFDRKVVVISFILAAGWIGFLATFALNAVEDVIQRQRSSAFFKDI
uniref:Uncharacterized protein n=1 Tax=Spongospora subterranea TaxID=70186 RepID=A0A0H5RR23_9EUKA|eukprot:CRZ11169.1 hypothetical protein [Spongospora subterranea]